MARIRSIHPGFFKDEKYVACSMPARLLFLGLGVEADDKGIFEWKPLTIKMNVFPADNVDVSALLSELEAADAIQKYEINGRHYGAIRNFRKYQRPKTPNSVHPITPEIGNYTALTQPASEMTEDEPGSFPPNGEKSPQMEDGGDKMEDEGGVIVPPDPQPAIDAWNAMAKPLKIPIIQRQTPERIKKLNLRLGEIGGIEGWMIMLEKIRKSRFLRGGSGDWRLSFDWVLNPKNLTKLMEGNYDERPNGSSPNDRKGTAELIREAVAGGDGEGAENVWEFGDGDGPHPPDKPH